MAGEVAGVAREGAAAACDDRLNTTRERTIDPDNFYSLVLKTGAPINATQYANPAFDKLIDQASHETDEATRKTLYSQLRQIVFDARGRIPAGAPALVVGLAASDDKVSASVVSTQQAVERGVTAKDVLQAVLTHVDGRGGGKDDVAQGGGTSPAGIPAALAAVDDAVRAAASR